ncbi:hypothetical protein KM043_005986 [Ampulex compressa]|nr:hypothetical protein KM043_005986 [Ampulex compressa]
MPICLLARCAEVPSLLFHASIRFFHSALSRRRLPIAAGTKLLGGSASAAPGAALSEGGPPALHREDIGADAQKDAALPPGGVPKDPGEASIAVKATPPKSGEEGRTLGVVGS